MTDTTSQPHHILHPHEVYANSGPGYQTTGPVDPRQQHHMYQQQPPQPPPPSQQPQPAYPMVKKKRSFLLFKL